MINIKLTKSQPFCKKKKHIKKYNTIFLVLKYVFLGGSVIF